MELREATPDDLEAIRAVARASLSASYGHVVSEEAIAELVDRWYDPSEMTADVASSRTVCPVAIESEAVVGFAESYVVDRGERVGEIDWLHVHPDHRGSGFGGRLLAYVEDQLRDREVDRIEGRVLATNESGTRFYEEEGYDRTDAETITVERETFEELVYTKRTAEDGSATESRVYTDESGDRVHVDLEESERGSKGPFYPAYVDSDHEERYGYLCGNCESLEIVVDTMERLKCVSCGNRRKPTRWDAAYL
ncbi:GNAT family N-acetyltransferase [Halopenitus sp. H-Gu1]|uniref:GNAT family N-acetyltransferase n=1 Tax=Halopenitus sp. H-Gu1 TaxID=3242697 RepID=UPI00359E4BE3